MDKSSIPTDFARLLESFFLQRLIQQRNASQQTVYSYRDTFRLLLRFYERKFGKNATVIQLEDINASLVLAFLDDVERQRHNCVRSRNNRLAAIRSFLRYAALKEPETLPVIQQVLAIPLKRFDRPLVKYLSQTETRAILEAPDIQTWSGQRDLALLATLYNTGARVSEIIAVRRMDLENSHSKVIHLHGKGRKEPVVPLWKRTSKILSQWLDQLDPDTRQPLFPNRFGQMMSRSGVESRLNLAVRKASVKCKSLHGRKISPHVVRHTTAMHLLQSGVDLSVIALWLGHESVVTTHQYMEADIQMKEKALSKLETPTLKFSRFKPSNSILGFLDAL